MTRHFIWVFPAMVAGVCAAQAESAKPPALAPTIEQCIRDNAAKVEAAIPDLNAGVDFLVGNLCAEPIAAEETRETKAATDRQYAQWQKVCDEEKAAAKNGKTGLSDKSTSGFCDNFKIGFLTEPRSDDSTYTIYPVSQRPAAAVGLASQLLLSLRLAHANSKSH